MTDLDTFRSILRATPAQDLGNLDIGQIMTKGSRIRRRRRALGGATIAGVLAAALLIAAVGVGRFSRPAVEPAGPGTGPNHPTPVGSVISTGIRDSAGDIMLYAVRIDDSRLPDIHFGLMAGHRGSTGQLSADVETNETSGSDRSPGFHAGYGASPINHHDFPEFGYYAGPAAKITATLGGKRVQAHQGTWSADPQIVVFWFSLTDVPVGAQPADLSAFDTNGHQLPTGNTNVNRG
jgi:hypothetical protein